MNMSIESLGPRQDPLATAMAGWVHRHGGGEALARWAVLATEADLKGNSAVRFDDSDTAELHADAMMSGADPAFRVDLGHFYLRRNHDDEVAVADGFKHRLRGPSSSLETDEATLESLFGKSANANDAEQREAVTQLRDQKLFVLTGGPGTGKTTTVLRILLNHRRQFVAIHGREPSVACCAPTGKAAQRLRVAMRSGAAEMAAGADAAHWAEGLEALAHVETSTLHRYVGRVQRGEPLRADILVLDESSMVDLALMRTLLGSMDAETQLLLVGDPDQLASVETGSAFSDLVAELQTEGSPALVELRYSFRSNNELQRLNAATRLGDTAAFYSAVSDAGPVVSWTPLANRQEAFRELDVWARRIQDALNQAHVFEPLPSDEDAVEARVRHALSALSERQLLCAVHDGDFGTRKANEHIERVVRRAAELQESEWYPGRSVLISKNDYALGLFNGDIGICLESADGNLQVWFDRQDAEAGNCGLIALPVHALPAYQPAFALSIHKSQGSEYPEVAVMLPTDADTRILSRQLLYTAVSRAKARLAIWSNEAALTKSLANAVARVGALKERLQA